MPHDFVRWLLRAALMVPVLIVLCLIVRRGPFDGGGPLPRG